MIRRNPFNTAAKRAIRELWNTPLLRELHQRYGFRYRYMGLPGVDLLDVKLWKDMIEEVIAFEIPARRSKSDRDGRGNINTLKRNLRLLNIPHQAFFGPIEEVVVLRKDYDGQDYEQTNVVTLYNLDFCDEIASRIETREHGRQTWRFDAFRHIFRDQIQAYEQNGGPRCFIALLTVRDQINADRLRELLSENLYGDTQSYLESCGGIDSLPSNGHLIGTHTWALKAFIHNSLRQYLVTPNISATFFPFVRYEGAPKKTDDGYVLKSPMLHCMFLCRFNDVQASSPAHQPYNYLASITSVEATAAGTLKWTPQLGELVPSASAPSPSAWLECWNLLS